MSDPLFDMLGEISRQFQGHMRMATERVGDGLTAFQAKILSMIARDPGCSQQTLAARVGCDKALIARAIKELAARRLVVRGESAQDWRAVYLEVTASGGEIVAALNKEREEISRRGLSTVTVENRARLQETLDQILTGLTAP